MWKFILKDGTVVTGDREQIAKELNFFDDVYDDDVWDEFCDGFNVQWVDNDNVDNIETINREKVYEFINDLHLQYEGKEIYFGTTKEFCKDHNMPEFVYYEDFSQDMIKLPKKEFGIKDLKIMFVVKNLETNETMQFETLEDVAEWFNFSEDIYADGVWDKFIELHSKTYEIRRIVHYISADMKVDKNYPIKNKEDDDLPF